MVEVYPSLFVGDQRDYDFDVAKKTDEWAVVHACKEPYHRRALGYTGRGAPKSHPEYYIAQRNNRLMMNIVDAEDPAFFSKEELIEPALHFIDEAMARGLKVLIHCNEGQSRSACIALLYMAARLAVLPTGSFESAEAEFRSIYPDYSPKAGIREHIRDNWDEYCNKA